MPATLPVAHERCCDDAILVADLFNREFARTENTLLLHHPDAWREPSVAPAAEPIYLPASADCCPFNRVVYAHGFATSALHEVAHWCLAGRERRKRIDYGYWYKPDDRNAEEQAEFEKVEVKPQAIEWAFSIVSGIRFQVSADNLSGIEVDREGFRYKVLAELRAYAAKGFPDRAQRFIDSLSTACGRRFELPHE